MTGADFKDVNDVGMLQSSNGFYFGAKSSRVKRVGYQSGLQHLQGDQPIKPALFGQVDDTHAAPAEARMDLELREKRGEFFGGRRRMPATARPPRYPCW